MDHERSDSGMRGEGESSEHDHSSGQDQGGQGGGQGQGGQGGGQGGGNQGQ
ncbi:hypothetical protein BH23CHL10_BH23CHL10_16400 [soil metagenome]